VTSVTIRELRNRGGDVVDRVEAGERVLVTRDGKPVAELRPLSAAALTANELIRRRRNLPVVDPAVLRRDIDEVIAPAL
jgi:prevent-host-death family protein